ncbi:MAG: TlpA disulfide reductase family protein [Cellulophaga sp.]
MKKILLTLLVIVSFASCSKNQDGFTLNGTLSGDIENGTKVFLKVINEQNQPVDIDTTTVENGVFVFNVKAEIPELHYIFIDKTQGNIPLIVEKGAVDLIAHKDSLNSASIKGAPQNDFFYKFLGDYRELGLRSQSINNDMRTASASQDEATMNALRDEYKELQDEAKNYELDFIKNNPESLISAITLFDKLRSKTLPQDEVKEIFDGFTQEIKNSKPGKKISTSLENGKSTAIGAKAPNFSAPTPTGETLALNDVLGKVTIIDFWAAWCRPCRAENPNVVNVYNKYHEKGLNIIGVSLDRKAEDWKKAITDDGLTWNHVSNVKYFDEIAQLYNINAIPATFILDENGIIIAKNVRGPALEQKIAELLP